MQKIILQKIDTMLERAGGKLLHCPPSPTGQYSREGAGVFPLEDIRSCNQAYQAGLAVLAYRVTGEEKYLRWCQQFAGEFAEKVHNRRYDTSQELGVLYSLYALPLYEITGEEGYREMALRAADELARRYLPHIGFLKAWGRADCHYPPYIDAYREDDPFFNENRGLMVIETMLQLPLLMWATRESNQPYYERIAAQHIRCTLQYLIRKDGSVAHGYRFNESTGEAYCEDNYFGFGVGSNWAKGAALAVLGFVLCSKYSRYSSRNDLGDALRILDKLIDRCGGKLPVWDFDCPEAKVDTQAAAILLWAVKEIQAMGSSASKIDASVPC